MSERDEDDRAHLLHRIGTAQWVFERHLSWIAAAEVKVGVVIAIQTALLGGLAAAFASSDTATRTVWTYVSTLSAAGAAVMALFCAAMVVLPRTDGPKESLLFFVSIGSQRYANYMQQFREATDMRVLADLTEQIHRNAQIATVKYTWVARSLTWSFLGAIPWVAAIGLLVKL